MVMQKTRILHIDDNEDFVEVFFLRFRKHFNITPVYSGEDGLDKLKEKSFDVIITDYDMPGMNGLELLKQIKEFNREIPVIFYTGQGSEQIAREAFVNGAVDYFTKNIHEFAHTDKLINSINKAIEIKESRNKIKKSEERFRSLVEATSDWIWEVDTNANFTYISPKIKDLLGYEPEEVLGKTPFDLMPPEEAKKISAAFNEIVEKRLPIERMENIAIHKNGSKVIIETSGIPIFDEDGNFTGYRGIDRDITKRKHLESKTEEIKKQCIDVVDSLQIINVLLDSEGKIIYCNKYLLDLTQWKKEEVIGKSWFDTFLPKDIKKDVYKNVFQNCINCNSFPEVYQNDLITKYGERVSVIWNNSVLRSDDSEEIQVLSFGIDISKQVEIQKALLHSNKKWLSTFNSIGDGIALITPDGTIKECNRAFIDFLGLNKNDIINRKCWTLVHKTSEPIEDCPILKMKKSHSRGSIELQIDKNWIEVTVDPIFDEKGEIIEAVHIVKDITDRKNFENILINKNKDLNEFAYRISHRLKSYIINIKGYIDLIDEDNSLFKDYFKNINRQMEKLSDYIKRLLRLAKAGSILKKKEKIDLNNLVRYVFYLSKKSDKIKMNLQIDENLPIIYADQQDMEELFSNLFENSIKYRDIQKEEVQIKVGYSLKNGNVLIKYEDNGIGIEEKYLDNICSPGFTVSKDKGTGFGMAIVKKIAEAYGGGISISSEGNNKGIQIQINLSMNHSQKLSSRSR